MPVAPQWASRKVLETKQRMIFMSLETKATDRREKTAEVNCIIIKHA